MSRLWRQPSLTATTLVDMRKPMTYASRAIKTFSSKTLADLWSQGATPKIAKQLHKRSLVRLDTIDQAEKVIDMNLPGFDFHVLRVFDPPRFTIHVNGPWCITFEFAEKNARRVDLELYH